MGPPNRERSVSSGGSLRVGVAALAARAAGAASRALGRGGGTALPGLIAERLAPDVMSHLAAQLPAVAVVTGTNGKTTTSHMLAAILSRAGRRPLRNASGSNLSRGIAGALVARASWTGRLQLAGAAAGAAAAVGLFETDEAAFAHVVPAVAPDVVVVTNLFRDQLDRYGEVDSVAAIWREALQARRGQTTLVLNADDPTVAALGDLGAPDHNAMADGDGGGGGAPGGVRRFGIDDARWGHAGLEHAADAKVCPTCGARLEYPVCYYGHLGHYRCPNGHARPTPDVRATRLEPHGFDGTDLTLATPVGEVQLRLPLPGLYNVYNALAAASGALVLGAPLEAVREGLAGFSAAFGRLERVSAGRHAIVLVLAKNPVGMNEALRTVFADGGAKHLLLALNDLDADGRDVSWIWDADFERAAGRTLSLTVAGRRADDLALRLKYAGATGGVTPVVEPEPGPALDRALAAVPPGETLYCVLTYTAMLALRRVLTERGHLAAYWKEDGVKLVLGHLYGDLLNLYADRGNIITLRQRCAWRGIELEVRQIGIGDPLAPDGLDLLFMGGGQDGDQRLMADDLFGKADALRGALQGGLPMLVVCGGYQLFGHYYQPAQGARLPGLGLFDLHTVHPGPSVPRCIGNVVVTWVPDGAPHGAPCGAPGAASAAARRTLVGFENHGGRTFLGAGARPLGRVVSGHGNNARDGTEGATSHHAFGTYLHGSLLPKNPHLADHLLALALARRHPQATLAPLDDGVEWRAHDVILRRYGRSA